MNLFVQHTTATATPQSAAILTKVVERYGFIPNLAAFLAESPVVLESLLNLAGAFDRTTLTPQEQQLVLLTVSTLNGCDYCKLFHSGMGHIAGIDADTLKTVIALKPLSDSKLNALCEFTRKVTDERGWVRETDLQAFLAAGYTKANVFEIVMGCALKTLTNYSNHLTGTTPNPEFFEMTKALNFA